MIHGAEVALIPSNVMVFRLTLNLDGAGTCYLPTPSVRLRKERNLLLNRQGFWSNDNKYKNLMTSGEENEMRCWTGRPTWACNTRS